MEQKKEIIPLSQTNDYSDVPSWYVLCTNGLCPFQGSCLRYQVASGRLWYGLQASHTFTTV